MRLQKNKGYIFVVLGTAVVFSIWKSNEMMESKKHILRYLGDDHVTNGSATSEHGLRADDIKVITDEEEDEPKLFFRYKPPPNAGLTTMGKTFKIPSDVARDTADLVKLFVTLTPATLASFVFAMAASDNHFSETKDGLASAQFHFPEKQIYYYDLGLNESQVEEVKSWKNVTYRYFNFSKYPAHFSANLRMCVWKPFIIRDLLKEFGAVFWMDASIRIHAGDFTPVYERILENGGVLLFKSTAHSNFAATHKGTYDFIPTRRKKQKELHMQCAAGMLMYNTREMFYSVLWWWFLCAYEENCQMPMPKTKCAFDDDNRMGTFADCHKWDQSTINILLSNYHGYNRTKYGLEEETGILTIERWPTNYYAVQAAQER